MEGYGTKDTICAPATAAGMAAIAVIRLSGPKAFAIAAGCFEPRKKGLKFDHMPSHRAVFGLIHASGQPVDEVLLTRFVAPHTYTGDDLVEISCHGSPFIQQEILKLLIDAGARMARPGEFTLRAFLNGRMDLSQAEAVADLIASNSSASHKMAFRQMRGHFSERITELRRQLVNFAGLIELELDFSEEDVEFADRSSLSRLLDTIETEIGRLKQSFRMGNVLKNGIPVAIIGKPNVGKSTLLNALLNEERAIVSEIPGTTRDTIEDVIVIEGVAFRFIDTAGLRHSRDVIETAGIERTYEKIRQAAIILYVFDASETTLEEITATLNELREKFYDEHKRLILVANKIDLMQEIPHHFRNLVELETIFVSAKRKENISIIAESLLSSVSVAPEEENQAIVTNSRHYEALAKTAEAIAAVHKGIEENLPGDLMAVDLRTALHHLGTITGEVTNDEILGNIFEKFCIGK
ncbi:MAG: tRNA uridine-5-carboxymethylaminomethyl(34) synthesis GTPase MnmE [Bacteroidales bacterium]|mgnify:CR=1 FL=1|nr:tRNA uridine-5-carboxymethylaminomethyl(34) synthesis GTPase MnmE [Bacteroidales bacterium]NLM92114.1 tRNA uridine-5-carboxymethylaminomethyl(34) synthesis GTPase MnmE [Bacteroidales bacterium]